MKPLRQRTRFVIGGAILVAWLAGCAMLGSRFESPHIHLAGIRLLEIRGFESVFEVDLRVVNPNNQSLPIQGVECDLALEGRHLAKGVANPQKEIQAYSSAIVPVIVYASMIDMVGVAHRLLKGAQSNTPDEKWHYAVKGHLRLQGSAWPGAIPFDAAGVIDLNELTGTAP